MKRDRVESSALLPVTLSISHHSSSRSIELVQIDVDDAAQGQHPRVYPLGRATTGGFPIFETEPLLMKIY